MKIRPSSEEVRFEETHSRYTMNTGKDIRILDNTVKIKI